MVGESTHCKTKSIRCVHHFLVNASNVENYLEINYVTPLIYKTTVSTVFVMQPLYLERGHQVKKYYYTSLNGQFYIEDKFISKSKVAWPNKNDLLNKSIKDLFHEVYELKYAI